MGDLSNLLPNLYATAQDVGRWVPVLDGLCELVGTRNASMQILEPDRNQLRPVVTTRDSYSLSHAELHDRYVNNDANPRFDLRNAGSVPSGLSEIVRYDDEFDTANPEFADLRARLTKIGLGQAVCLSFELRPGRYFSLILHRSIDDTRGFDQRDESLLREMRPHLRQAVDLYTSFQEAHATTRLLQVTVDGFRLGVVLCDAEGRVHWGNRSAHAIIGRSALLQGHGDRLSATRPQMTKALRRLLAAVPGEFPPLLALEDGGDMLQIRALPLGGQQGETTLRALFLSDDTVPLEVSPEDVSRLFNLSPAEARLAAALAGGASVTTYSKARGISVGTARVQLKQVLAKMQAGKQADLTRRLCTSVAAQTIVRPH